MVRQYVRDSQSALYSLRAGERTAVPGYGAICKAQKQHGFHSTCRGAASHSMPKIITGEIGRYRNLSIVERNRTKTVVVS